LRLSCAPLPPKVAGCGEDGANAPEYLAELDKIYQHQKWLASLCRYGSYVFYDVEDFEWNAWCTRAEVAKDWLDLRAADDQDDVLSGRGVGARGPVRCFHRRWCSNRESGHQTPGSSFGKFPNSHKLRIDTPSAAIDDNVPSV